MGTPEFSVPGLDMLIKEGYQVVAVVTQPDKPKGRGKKLAAPPVKEYALKNGIAVLQPAKVRTEEFDRQIRELAPDMIVTIAYGRILPKNILNIPLMGCINVHGSLLPKYRGAAPIQQAVINGEKMTGVTTMYMDVGMDTGDMLLKGEMEITEDMTAGELHDRMSLLGAEILRETVKGLETGSLQRSPQNESEATHAPMMKKETGEIDWKESAQKIHNLVRGTNPWPGAYTFYKGGRMRVWKTRVVDVCGIGEYKPGTIVAVESDGIAVAAGQNFIEIKEIQFDSCRRMCIGEYMCGHVIEEGTVLG